MPTLTRAALLTLGALVIPAALAAAQTTDPADARVTQILAAAKQAYSLPPKSHRCAAATDGEIVVCGRDSGEDQRVPSTAQSDPNSRSALRTGVPRAPQLDRGSCKGQSGCMVGGRVPPPIYYINVKALPEAPVGSDADLVAKGEQAAR